MSTFLIVIFIWIGYVAIRSEIHKVDAEIYEERMNLFKEKKNETTTA